MKEENKFVFFFLCVCGLYFMYFLDLTVCLRRGNQDLRSYVCQITHGLQLCRYLVFSCSSDNYHLSLCRNPQRKLSTNTQITKGAIVC